MTVPPEAFDPQLVLDVIEESLPEHPVYLASLSERFYASSRAARAAMRRHLDRGRERYVTFAAAEKP
jgi:hypothetical protein